MQVQPNIKVDVQSWVLFHRGIIGSTLHQKVFLAYFPPHFCNYSGAYLFWQY